ncbi:Uncharacterised protein [Yersinia intermedia]|nr:Uncharacterised protein [Yersinia intermedia]VDZ59738.1 Uncharacterised protein [Yersinia intermedia]
MSQRKTSIVEAAAFMSCALPFLNVFVDMQGSVRFTLQQAPISFTKQRKGQRTW